MTGPWTFTANSRGYMFFRDGKPMGGAGVLPNTPPMPGRMRAKQTRQYAEYCRRECDRRNQREPKA